MMIIPSRPYHRRLSDVTSRRYRRPARSDHRKGLRARQPVSRTQRRPRPARPSGRDSETPVECPGRVGPA
eukprot:82763-Hanusia_phi.AAC.1